MGVLMINRTGELMKALAKNNSDNNPLGKYSTTDLKKELQSRKNNNGCFVYFWILKVEK